MSTSVSETDLLHHRKVPPISADIVQRFGLSSPTFLAVASTLREALKVLPTSIVGADLLQPTADLSASGAPNKRQQWTFHLAQVYGSTNVGAQFIAPDELFVRHTYLCQFAKMLAYAAYFGVEKAIRQIEDIIDGTAFEALGTGIPGNIGEYDFFSWVLAPQVRTQTINAFRHMADNLAIYDLQSINEDLLKQLYQNLVEPETRHGSGEFYTPDWLAELILREIGYHPGLSLLDPACGSGTFLFTAIRLLVEQGLKGQRLVDFALQNIKGMDRHPLAVTIARVNYLLALLPHLQSNTVGADLPQPTADLSASRGPIYSAHPIPVAMANALQTPGTSQHIENIKVDIVVGNPPWLSYRYLLNRASQREIKELIDRYQLLARGNRQLHTQIELATLFFEHCHKVHLKPGGTIAFVMPRTVLTGAKQHRAFQQHSFSNVLDLKGVEPLFNVETCVLIRNENATFTEAIPITCLNGTLPAHECTFPAASALLTRTTSTMNLARPEMIGSPYYYSQFKQGAALVPRNLLFVEPEPGQISPTTIMRTDPEVKNDAKAPWKSLSLQGYIDADFLYATLLSKHLLPFGVRRLHLVALPVQVQGERFMPLSLEEMSKCRDRRGRGAYVERGTSQHSDAGWGRAHCHPERMSRSPERSEGEGSRAQLAESATGWFEQAEQLWQQHKKETTRETLAQWLNYQNKLLGQRTTPGYLVLYGAAGSNLAATVIDTSVLPLINGKQPTAFVADSSTYWYRSRTKEEAHFLSALLNAPCVNRAIKSYQTRGLFGERHIHRRPFEVCPIPQFDVNNPDHQQLAALSEAATVRHTAVTALHLSPNGVGAARKQSRQGVRTYIEQIDEIAQQLLGLAPSALP